MSSNHNPSDANDRTSEDEDDGPRANSFTDNDGIASDSATHLDTQTQHFNSTPSASASTSTSTPTNDTPSQAESTNSNNNMQSTTAAAAPTAPHSRWSQTVGTTIFSYDPNTRRLIPIAGTLPITTWAPPGPAGMASPFDNPPNGGMTGTAGFGGSGAGVGPGGDPLGIDLGDEGHMSTHLSFSTADGRPIPFALMHHILQGLIPPHATAAAAATAAIPNPQPQGLGAHPSPSPVASSSSAEPVSPLPGRRRERHPTSDQQANGSWGATPAQVEQAFARASRREMQAEAETERRAAEDGLSMDEPNLFHIAADDPNGLSRMTTAIGGVQRLARPGQASLQSVQAAQATLEHANQQREMRRERREMRQLQVERDREYRGRRASSVPPPSTSTSAGEAEARPSGFAEATSMRRRGLGDLLSAREPRDFWPTPVPETEDDDDDGDEMDRDVAGLHETAMNAQQELQEFLEQPPLPPPSGMGWLAPVMGPDGQMTTRFVRAGMPPGMGMPMPMPPGLPLPPGMLPGTGIAGIAMPPGPFGLPFGLMGMGMPPGMEMERPPDTRRAKELLRGLTLLPKGLVRRMERVEKMLGEDARTESGRLVCAVCYDPLLAAPLSDDLSKPEGKEEAAMELDKLDTSDDGVDLKPSQQHEDTAPKRSKKAPPKPKHFSLHPTALIALPCTHVFHAVDCLLPWFEQGKTTCPTCRFDVDPRSETLNVARWLGGARRRAAAAQRTGQANTEGNITAENNRTDTAVNGSVEAAVEEDALMDAEEEEDDETDAFTGEEEAFPAELDPGVVFRDAIGRAIASALRQALMNPNPTPPQQQTPQTANDPSLNPPIHVTQRRNPALDVIMLDAGGPQLPSGEQTSDARYPSAENIELPGANRDQYGRMLRDDGESSIAATNNSTPRTLNGDLELSPAMERTQSHRQRGARAQAPSPSPHVSPPPQQSTSGLRANLAPNIDRLDRFWMPQESLPQDQHAPTAGSSSSFAQAPPTSRPPTPRHHPYAHHSRPATNARPTPTATPAPPGFASMENPPVPWNPAGENPAPGTTGAPAPTLPFTHEHDGGRVSITRHSITFNLALPLPSLFGPPAPSPAAGDPAVTTNGGANPVHQQQQAGVPPNPVPDFLNSIFSHTNLFGPPPGSTTTGRDQPPNRPRKKWVAPEGTSLRSVVESKERQVGLRCDDVSCLWAPEDEDDETMEVKIHPERTFLRKASTDAKASCAHRYHPECLLVASRVAEVGLDREIDDVDAGEWLEVACPFCRIHGGQEKPEWRMHRELANAV